MTKTEHLLTIAAEECSEIAQRASKAVRFGLDEVQPDEGQNPAALTNAERLLDEFHDLCGVLHLLGYSDTVLYTGTVAQTHRAAKADKVKRYLAYSLECGTLENGR